MEYSLFSVYYLEKNNIYGIDIIYKVLMQSFLIDKRLVYLQLDFMQLLVIVVIHYTSKIRSSVVPNCGFMDNFNPFHDTGSVTDALKSCGFNQTSLYMPVILLNPVIELINSTMICIRIKAILFELFERTK